MKLITGDLAPDFTVTDFLNKKIKLSDFKGRKIMLSFFRGAPCPFCNLRVHELIKNYGSFERKGLVIVAFFASDAKEIENYAGKQFPPFSIIPDKGLEIYKLYDIKSSPMGMVKSMFKLTSLIKIMNMGFFNLKSISEKPLLPADFLIDSNLKIVKTYFGADYGDHINIQEIKNWLDEK